MMPTVVLRLSFLKGSGWIVARARRFSLRGSTPRIRGIFLKVTCQIDGGGKYFFIPEERLCQRLIDEALFQTLSFNVFLQNPQG